MTSTLSIPFGNMLYRITLTASCQVLAEVATFVTASTLHRGHYCLKKDMWAQFDPFFPQYTPRARQAAVNRGLEQKLWKPHQQLRGFADSLPAGLKNLQHVPTCAFSIRSAG